MAEQRLTDKGEPAFLDPYEYVRGTDKDPAREHDPRLIRNTPDTKMAAAMTQQPAVAPEPSRRRRNRRPS